jgi:predicted nucleotidyltransferase
MFDDSAGRRWEETGRWYAGTQNQKLKNETKDLTMLSSETNRLSKREKEILLNCRDALNEIDPNAEVVLYGSRARGDASEESDYDLLIVSDGPATIEREDRFRRALYDIQLETGAVVTVILVNRTDWETPLYKAMPLHQNITREGISL